MLGENQPSSETIRPLKDIFSKEESEMKRFNLELAPVSISDILVGTSQGFYMSIHTYVLNNNSIYAARIRRSMSEGATILLKFLSSTTEMYGLMSCAMKTVMSLEINFVWKKRYKLV